MNKPKHYEKDMTDIPQRLYKEMKIAFIRLELSYLTWGAVMQSGSERGFRYFKVSPIKALRDVCHVVLS